MMLKPGWTIKRMLVLATVALVFIGFFEKRRPQFQPNKKAITEQVAECDADEDADDDDLIGGSTCYLAYENHVTENTFAGEGNTLVLAPVCGKKGKSLPKWMMYRQLKIDGHAI